MGCKANFNVNFNDVGKVFAKKYKKAQKNTAAIVKNKALFT